jgi:hypothetical protein
LPRTGQQVGSPWHQIVLVTVTVGPGCPGAAGWKETGGAGVAAWQSPRPRTWNTCLPPTVALKSPRTQAPSTARVTRPLTVMSLSSSVRPWQSTVTTVVAEGAGVLPDTALLPPLP